MEDDPGPAELAEAVLTCAGYSALTAPSLAAARALLRRGPPDLILLDLTLGDADGLDFLRGLRARPEAPLVPVIVMTASPVPDLEDSCLNSGADDYIQKPFHGDSLLAHVAAVLRRCPPRDTTVWGPFRMDRSARQAHAGRELLDLTKTEFDVLARLVEARGATVTADGLLAGVLKVSEPDCAGPSRKSLLVHVSNLRRKLGPREGLIRNVPGIGYRLAEPGDP